MYYTLASELNVAANLLFMENDVYDYKLDYEMTIIGYYNKHNKKNRYNLALLSMSVMYHGYEIDNVLSNYKFYAAAMQPQSTMLPSMVSNLQCIGQDVVVPLYGVRVLFQISRSLHYYGKTPFHHERQYSISE